MTADLINQRPREVPMKTNVRKMLTMIFLFGMGAIVCASAQQGDVPKDDDLAVVDFKDMQYPIPAQIGHVQGAVVVQVKLDEHGGVSDAQAISGPVALALAAVNNVKKWRFRPNARKSAVIVYNFVFLEGRCESHGSLFVLQPSNLATVIGCSAAVNSSSSR